MISALYIALRSFNMAGDHSFTNVLFTAFFVHVPNQVSKFQERQFCAGAYDVKVIMHHVTVIAY
jgi:adenosine/AMP kinase